MKKRILIMTVLLAVALLVKAQNFVRYERFVDDGHVWHNCINAFEASDGNIIMLEECCDTIIDYSGVYTESVNLIKIDPQGQLIHSEKVDFSATSRHSPFLRNPFESNSNVMAGFYLGEDDELHYNAIFFDDNLSVIDNVDVIFPVEGFSTSYRSMTDNNNNLVFVSKENGSGDTSDTYIFVRMNVYGEIDIVKKSVSENYLNVCFKEKTLYMHSENPLQYGCHFSAYGGDISSTSVILDENFEIIDFVDFDRYTIDDQTYSFNCSMSEMLRLKDGSILMSSQVDETHGMNNEIEAFLQLTKFNDKYEIIDRETVASRPLHDYENYFYANSYKSVLEDNKGNIYLIWNDGSNRYKISYLNCNLEPVWETTLLDAGEDIGLLYGAFVTTDNKLVLYGDHVKVGEGYFGVCYIVTNEWSGNETISIQEQDSTKSFSIYPNPAKDVVKISSAVGRPSVVKVYNCLGMLVEEIEMNSEEMEINVSDYNPGVYFINVDGETMKVFKN